MSYYSATYSACVQETIESNRQRDRQTLAATLTRLRAEYVKTSDIAAQALDDVAKAHGLITVTVTEVRYTA